jgi:hypothetical protein
MTTKKTVEIVAENPQDGTEIPLTVSFTYSYDPGRYYMPNGDPGYPPEESFDIDDIYITNDKKLPIPEWITDALIEDIIVDSELIYEEDGYDE